MRDGEEAGGVEEVALRDFRAAGGWEAQEAEHVARAVLTSKRRVAGSNPAGISGYRVMRTWPNTALRLFHASENDLPSLVAATCCVIMVMVQLPDVTVNVT